MSVLLKGYTKERTVYLYNDSSTNFILPKIPIISAMPTVSGQPSRPFVSIAQFYGNGQPISGQEIVDFWRSWFQTNMLPALASLTFQPNRNYAFYDAVNFADSHISVDVFQYSNTERTLKVTINLVNNPNGNFINGYGYILEFITFSYQLNTSKFSNYVAPYFGVPYIPNYAEQTEWENQGFTQVPFIFTESDVDPYNPSFKQSPYPPTASGGWTAAGWKTDTETILGLVEYSELKMWPGPSSETGGAGGDFDDTSDAISVPALPSVQVAAIGNFLTMFNPTLAELEQVGDLMFSQGFYNIIKNLFADPINAVVSLHLTPFPLTVEDTKKDWIIGSLNTEIAMSRIVSQFIEYDFGTLDLSEYWGNTLDYSPYTKAEIYLPYIGSRSLNIDDIMQSSIGLKYHVDLLTGTITAYIVVTKHDPRSPMDEQASVMYQFSGNCNTQIPISGADYSGLVRNIITLAGIIGTGIATGGLATAGEGALLAEGTGSAALGAATAMAVNGSKPDISHSGSAGSVAGALGVQSAYITLTRPAQSLPEDYAHQFGYPSNITARLGDLSGYTVVNSVHVGIAGATADELAEIERLLKSGVIL